MSNRKRVPRRPRPKRKKQQRSNLSGMLVLGFGLILVGMAAFMLWPRPEASASSSSSGFARTVPAEVDFEAPELTLYDLDEVEHSLVDYRGQVVLVNLWATWCPPCKAEMPTLKAYYEAHQAEGFTTVAISDGDPADAVEAFVLQYELPFVVLLDPTYIATEQAFKTRNLPSSFVIDRDGQVVLRWVGEIDRDTLEEYVTPLILKQ